VIDGVAAQLPQAGAKHRRQQDGLFYMRHPRNLLAFDLRWPRMTSDDVT
jgi:hypothetical protein